MDDIALLLQGAIRARGQVLLKLNVAAAQLDAVLDRFVDRVMVIHLKDADRPGTHEGGRVRHGDTADPDHRCTGRGELREAPESLSPERHPGVRLVRRRETGADTPVVGGSRSSRCLVRRPDRNAEEKAPRHMRSESLEWRIVPIRAGRTCGFPSGVTSPMPPPM